MMQEERSQHRNRAKAMAVLRAQALRLRAPEAGRRARRRAARPGRHRRPLRAHPHLQFSARPRHRPPHQSHALQAAAGDRGRSARRDHRRAGHRAPGRAARGRGRVMTRAATRAPCCSAATIARVPRCGARLAQGFRAAGIDSPELDARLLVGHALGLDHAALAAAGDRMLDARRAKRAIAALARAGSRASRSRASSAARNSGACRLRVDAATLVPRPETETVVEAALAAIDRDGPRARRAAHRRSRHRLAARSCWRCCRELPDAFGVGTDIERRGARDGARQRPAARRDAARAFVACDMARRCAGRSISSSPIRPTSRPARSPRWRPKCAISIRALALDGGPDGLDCYRAIAAAAPRAAGARRRSGGRNRRGAGGRGRAHCSPRRGLRRRRRARSCRRRRARWWRERRSNGP